MRLLGAEPQTEPLKERLDCLTCLFRLAFCPAEHDEVVGVPHEADPEAGCPAELVEMPVEEVQGDIRQQERSPHPGESPTSRTAQRRPPGRQRNRLVTGELERRWEEALRELKTAEEELAREEADAPRQALPADLLGALADVGSRLPELWDRDQLLRTSQKKALLRTLIDKVVLHRVAADRIHTRVVWRGGATTSADVPVSVGSFAHLSGAQQMEETIVTMAQEGCSDAALAEHLTSLGYRSPQHSQVLVSTVKNVRLSHRIFRRASQSHPRRVSGFLTIPQLAERLDIAPHWIYDRIHNGTIQVQKDASTQCYRFPDQPETLEQFRQLLGGQIGQIERLGS